ncbi:Murein DD-endopeptidase MepM and murein hydrolase activator NlpD, contain LysM domain [Pedobacter westerhofensis]|uniref:Murein DD-endopeptidase MepM and murein hydrolase activator NlpD, contain LysM domain n=1 Tax=Pedobacter westerhofensis TaxID=425512 RepID=A0A521CLJ1_9SPHI|nr:peptidoglycan DD-metalloendopeptidase family protein [Pedobacter westerhofensis]SMO60235.1 Murein DD-endopeptidase MepM and murein hydrolase activator NlpD, contain LysM domain [Pedobacter westerhofensis]
MKTTISDKGGRLILHIFYLLAIAAILFSCKSGQVNLFKPASPHEQYQRKLVTAGLDKTSMGSAWIVSSLSVLQKALTITIPYRESGYFPADAVSAAAYRFSVARGQKISIELSKKPLDQFMIYTDVWEQPENGQVKLLASGDTISSTLVFEARTSGTILIRLQPELLRGGQYTLDITAGPSLGFPVKSSNSSHIQSIFGDGRDKNSRKHEGIDIFATFRTPAIAAAAGTIIRVNENNLGGKVVWLRPKDKDYTLYYAHLDQQIATEGQSVAEGDKIGLIGNTGNARTTLPHLHFGVYTSDGAIDPMAFVNTAVKPAVKISASVNNLNATMRTTGKAGIFNSTVSGSRSMLTLKPGTVMTVTAANAGWYRVKLPDGEPGFIQSKELSGIAKPLKRIKIGPAQQELLDRPDSLLSCRKLALKEGSTVEVLGNYGNYQLVKNESDATGWIRQ